MRAPASLRDAEVPAYVAALGLPGVIDLHTHFMPERVQAKVWAHFDRQHPSWPILYRSGEAERLATLAGLGVRHHTALAYAHRPGMPEPAWPLPPGIGERLGPLRDRVLFGSDLPSVPRSFANQISGLSALGLGDDWQRAVLWHNAARLLGLDAQPA